jgi:hypothetical protein
MNITPQGDTPLAKQAQRNGSRWCHMATDGDPEELHAMARKLGLKREWYQDRDKSGRLHNHPHYDLTPSKRTLAIRYGAKEVTTMELIRSCYPQMVSNAGIAKGSGVDHE